MHPMARIKKRVRTPYKRTLVHANVLLWHYPPNAFAGKNAGAGAPTGPPARSAAQYSTVCSVQVALRMWNMPSL